MTSQSIFMPKYIQVIFTTITLTKVRTELNATASTQEEAMSLQRGFH